VTLPAKTAVIAVGGNALIHEGQHGTIAEQFVNARDTATHVGALVSDGWRVVLTHGNGPQVGFILRRSEMASDARSARLPSTKRSSSENVLYPST